MNDRDISDLLTALDHAEREIIRARGLVLCIAQHPITVPALSHAAVIPHPGLHDEPPSRPCPPDSE